MIRVKVKLHLSLCDQCPGLKEHSTLTLSENSKVEDLLQKLRLPLEKVKIVAVNGRIMGSDEILAEGDTVSLFPYIGGG